MRPGALAAGLLLLGGAGARCSLSGEDCRGTRCCARPNERCFEKNQWWASCRQSCVKGTSGHEDDPPQFRTGWSCNEVKPLRELMQCAGRFDDCRETRCCKESGARCFEKNARWAQCKSKCHPGSIDPADLPRWRTPWNCSLLLPAAGHVHHAPVPTTTTPGTSRPVLHHDLANTTLEALRSMQSEVRKLQKETSPNASVALELAEIQSDLRALQRWQLAAPANRTIVEVQAALRGMKDEISTLLHRGAPDAPPAPAPDAHPAPAPDAPPASVDTPLRGMAARHTPPIPQATAAPADAHVQGTLPSFLRLLGHLRTQFGRPTATMVGALAAMLVLLGIGCLVTGGCRGRRAKAASLQVVAIEEEPLVKRQRAEGQPGHALCEDTWASSEGQDRSAATALEDQLATLTSELSTLRARSQHLEARYKEAEAQRGGHLEERRRLLGELEAAASRAEEAERARAGLVEEQLRLERDRLAEGEGRAGKIGKCGCSVQ